MLTAFVDEFAMGFNPTLPVSRRAFIWQTIAMSTALAKQSDDQADTTAFAKRRPPAARPPGPELLTFPEIVQLYQEDVPPPPLEDKLNKLLTTPFVSNKASAAGRQPVGPESEELGKFLRVVQWNIERGLEFDAIRLAFTDPRSFSALMNDKGSTAKEEDRQRIDRQIGMLQQADLLVLNEVDWGVNRTRFRNVAAELAEAFEMNFAYGVEFVEVDPITMGIDPVIVNAVVDAYKKPGESKSDVEDYLRELMKPDPEQYCGLHGTAILTRYPLENVRLVPFRFQGHDWFKDEKNSGISEKLESKAGIAAFKEQLVRQVRRGGRMMLFADIVDPALPSGRVTVAATHLEDVTSPENRRKQLEELLDQIQGIYHPVIVAGDMNTSTHSGVPTTVVRALKERFGNAKWWAEEGATTAIKYGTPFGWASSASLAVFGFARKIDDPTKRSIPLLGDNSEAKFFSTIENFRFKDGGCFDFRGVNTRSCNGRSGTLADSNERGTKGFVPTEELGRTFGPVGEYKLDWIFVRPARLTKPDAIGQSYQFAPHFGRTLTELNHAIPKRISDHSPIIADLPLKDPPA